MPSEIAPGMVQLQDPALPALVAMGTFRNDEEARAPAVEAQELPVLISNSSSSTTSWHPKLTPYRLSNLLIPVCLGTTKAIASLSDSPSAATTLEWVSGVVLFLVLFYAGYLESNEHLPRFLAWAFEIDCMEFLWYSLGYVSVARPKYRSDERREPDTEYIVTSYRLLVSVTVVSLGLAKAYFTYAGFFVASTWMDWLLGVAVASGLYIVGLYEDSSAGIWPTFFGHDRAPALRSGARWMFVALAMSFGACVLVFGALVVSRPHPSKSRELVQFVEQFPEALGPQDLRMSEDAFNSQNTLISIFLFVVGGVMILLGLAWARFHIPLVGGLFQVIEEHLPYPRKTSSDEPSLV